MPPQLRLSELLNTIPGVHWDSRYGDYPVSLISCDSREDQSNGMFIALDGLKFKGDDFIKDAITHGAKVVVKKSGTPGARGIHVDKDIAIVETEDPRRFLRDVTARFYGHPSGRVKTVGITGTNGKTTITYLLEAVIEADKKHCGVLGTVNHRINGEIIPSKNTTPGFLDNQRYLAKLDELHTEFCVMEVSSHALRQGRVDGIDFSCAIFTNLTQDHLDYHKDMEDYFQAKSLLFTGLRGQASAIINGDDPYGRRLTGMSQGRITTFGIDSSVDVRAVNVNYRLDGTTFDLLWPAGRFTVSTPLIGRHNVYNILAAAAAALAMEIQQESIVKGIESLRHVPGRLERVDAGQNFYLFIDYAHTDDGLINVLNALRTVSQNKIIVVFGCGGDRDRGKRPKMAKAVCAGADFAIVTSDNPRSEDPYKIIEDIIAGFSRDNYEVCVDRKEAIGRAIKMARAGEIVLLAGKGHEDYQIIQGKTLPFNERRIAEEWITHVQH